MIPSGPLDSALALRAATDRIWDLENELVAVRDALDAERAPRERDGVPLTLPGRVRALGDQRRHREREHALAARSGKLTKGGYR